MTWTEVAALRRKESVVVLVPIAGYAEHGEELPLDVEERVLMNVVREASLRRAEAVELLVTPPLRFVTGPAGGGAFTVEAPLAHAFIDDVCASLAAAGFRKIVLCNASACNEALCDVAARDIRVERGLQMFCVNLSALGVRVTDAGESGRIESAGGRLAGLLAEIARRAPLANDGRIGRGA